MRDSSLIWPTLGSKLGDQREKKTSKPRKLTATVHVFFRCYPPSPISLLLTFQEAQTVAVCLSSRDAGVVRERTGHTAPFWLQAPQSQGHHAGLTGGRQEVRTWARKGLHLAPLLMVQKAEQTLIRRILLPLTGCRNSHGHLDSAWHFYAGWEWNPSPRRRMGATSGGLFPTGRGAVWGSGLRRGGS